MLSNEICQLEKCGYVFDLIPKENRIISIVIQKKPSDSEGLTAINFYLLICEIFDKFSEEVCNTIEYKLLNFSRGSSELAFYREISTELRFFC